MNSGTEIRDLFGGALSIDLPTEYVDASKLRQVPDNQEVFLQADGPTSLIIEILECPQNVETKEEGCLYYLKDLVEGKSNFEVLGRIKMDPHKEFIHATIDKEIDIKLYCHRLEEVDADLLITMNRQLPGDPLSFEDIVASLVIKDWTLFK